MNDIRVLVVEDSPIMRHFLTEAIDHSPGFQVVAAAHNAADAWTKLQSEGPDVMTLDVEMPDMDGVTFLTNLMKLRPIPVVMVSALTQSGSATTLRALRAGAVDFIGKPVGGSVSVTNDWVIELLKKLRRAYATRPSNTANHQIPQTWSLTRAAKRVRSARKCLAEVVVIGCGSGDIEALHRLLTQFPRDCPPIVVAQQFPDIMGQAVVACSGDGCELRLKSSTDSDTLLRGQVIFVNGSSRVRFNRVGRDLRILQVPFVPDQLRSACVESLFDSCAQNVGRGAVGILLDSALDDGAQALQRLGVSGARVLVQNVGARSVGRELNFGSGVASTRSLGAPKIEYVPLDLIPTLLFDDVPNDD